jgi:hypothetical protein
MSHPTADRFPAPVVSPNRSSTKWGEMGGAWRVNKSKEIPLTYELEELKGTAQLDVTSALSA